VEVGEIVIVGVAEGGSATVGWGVTGVAIGVSTARVISTSEARLQAEASNKPAARKMLMFRMIRFITLTSKGYQKIFAVFREALRYNAITRRPYG